MENAVKAALQRGGTSWGTMAFEFFTPGLCGVLAAAGADFVFLDMEHSGAGIDTIKAQCAFARGAGITPLVRVPYCERAMVTATLDAGAAGIMAPMVETAEQATAFASWCRYRPDGTRGLAFGIAHDAYRARPATDAMAAANAAVMVIPLIEFSARHRQRRGDPRRARCRSWLAGAFRFVGQPRLRRRVR